MTRASTAAWAFVHKWSSLICTLFLLMLCITGLPLIFHEEIDALTVDPLQLAKNAPPSSHGGLPLDVMVKKATDARPGEVPVFMAFDNDQPLMTVTTAPRPDSPEGEMTVQLFDRSTGLAVGAEDGGGVMHFILQLHTDMFLGLPGMLFLGLMAE